MPKSLPDNIEELKKQVAAEQEEFRENLEMMESVATSGMRAFALAPVIIAIAFIIAAIWVLGEGINYWH